jgi:hypothetical protein
VYGALGTWQFYVGLLGSLVLGALRCLGEVGALALGCSWIACFRWNWELGRWYLEKVLLGA